MQILNQQGIEMASAGPCGDTTSLSLRAWQKNQYVAPNVAEQVTLWPYELTSSA